MGAVFGECTPLSALHDKDRVSVAAPVLEVAGPKPTKKDNVLTVRLAYDTSNASSQSWTSLVIFRGPSDGPFPDVQQGDVLHARGLRVQTYQGKAQLLSFKTSIFVVYRRMRVGRAKDESWHAVDGKCSEPVTDAGLCVELDGVVGQALAPSVHPSARQTLAPSTRQTLTVAEVRPGVFFDLVAEVVWLSSAPDSDGRFSAIFADYTENQLVRAAHADAHGALLHVTFWDEYAAAAATLLTAGAVARLRNLHARNATASTSQYEAGSLVAAMHGSTDPASSRISLLSFEDPAAAALLGRRPGRPASPMHLERRSPVRRAAKRSAGEGEDSDTPLDASSQSFSAERVGGRRERYTSGRPVTTVSCGGLQESTVADMLSESAPCPAFWLVRGRVVGHRPSQVADFSSRYCTECRRSVGPARRDCAVCREPGAPVYRFSLTLDDGCGQLEVQLTRDDALAFLGEPSSAADLQSPEGRGALVALEQQMARLLASSASSPFCIESFMGKRLKRPVYRLRNTHLL